MSGHTRSYRPSVQQPGGVLGPVAMVTLAGVIPYAILVAVLCGLVAACARGGPASRLTVLLLIALPVQLSAVAASTSGHYAGLGWRPSSPGWARRWWKSTLAGLGGSLALFCVVVGSACPATPSVVAQVLWFVGFATFFMPAIMWVLTGVLFAILHSYKRVWPNARLLAAGQVAALVLCKAGITDERLLQWVALLSPSDVTAERLWYLLLLDSAFLLGAVVGACRVARRQRAAQA